MYVKGDVYFDGSVELAVTGSQATTLLFIMATVSCELESKAARLARGSRDIVCFPRGNGLIRLWYRPCSSSICSAIPIAPT